MKPSTPAPISPVSRKLRSDSKLSALPPEAQSLLLQKLETQSYQETASWLQDTHRIRVSPSNLSTFRSRHLESEALKEAYLQSATFHATLQDLQQQDIDPGDAQVEAAVRRLFLFKVVNQGDIGTYLHFTRVGNESKKLVLTQAREERLQQERQNAPSASEVGDLSTPTDLASSSFSSLHPITEPCAPRAPFPIGVGTSRPHTVPQDSNPSETDHPSSSPNSPCCDSNSQPSLRSDAPAPFVSNSPLPPPRPASINPDPGSAKASASANLLDSFQQALDAVMPLGGAEPAPPSSLDPFFATIIGTVIGRMLDLIQSGKFPPASSSPSVVTQSAAPPAPESDQPSAACTPSPESTTDSNAVPPVALPVPEVEVFAQSASGQSSLSSSSNSLNYPKTPSTRRPSFSNSLETRLP